jgi:hypothetical protein
MAHYTCPECKGVADQPKVCETENCAKKGQDLQNCNCEDGQHAEVQTADSAQ